MTPFLFQKPLQSKIQTKLSLMSLNLLLPLKKQSLNLQNMKLCEPILQGVRPALQLQISLHSKHSDKYIFYTLRFDCSFAAANTIKPQLL